MWRTKARFVAAACGRGSGKTELARRRVVRFLPVKKDWSDPMYFYALPTVAQAKRVAWRKIKALVPPSWITKVNESEMLIETKFGSSLYVVGMDKPQRIEGDQWDGGVIDESCDQKPKSFDLSVRPALSWRKGWCWRIGVPKRYGIGAQDFKDFWQMGMNGEDDDVESFNWPSEDILLPEEIAAAQRMLDPRDYNEQYRARWEQVSGRIFYAFDTVQNVQDVTYNPSLPLLIGSDFNVDPMSWIIGQRRDDKLFVLDELFIRNTNTQQTLDALYKKYGTHQSGFEFYGDASGSARKTSAATSDYLQIRNDTRFHNARVYYPKSNPRLKNRFAACNALFCNAAGQRRCLIHPRCKNLIRDLTDRSYKEGTTEPDDYNDLGHMSDALGYPIHRLWPIILQDTGGSPGVFVG
jgi:hypothetical protein